MVVTLIINFSPNLLHLAPPNVKAHCAELKKFGTEFPEEFRNNYKRMRGEFPIEIMTGVSLDFFLKIYIFINKINFDKIFEIFLQSQLLILVKMRSGTIPTVS